MSEATSEATLTVEDALLAIARSRSFTEADVNFGHQLAAKADQGVVLTGKQKRAAWRMLRKYDRALREQLGLAWNDIPQPGADDGVSDGVRRRSEGSGSDSITVTVNDGRIAIKSHYRHKDTCKSIPGARWNANKRQWTYPESPSSALAIIDAFTGVGIDSDERFDRLCDEGEEMRAAAAHKEATELPAVPGLNKDAWLHQRQAFWFLKPQEAGAAFMAMGTGKTLVAVALHNTTDVHRTLVICPSSVIRVWPREFTKHSDRPVHVVHGLDDTDGSVAARVKAFDQAFHECRCGCPHVCVVNYEVLAYQAFKEWSLEQQYGYLIFDESHRIKASNGVWSKHCAKLRDRAERRLALTGTPLPQSPLDVFGQYRALDPGVFGTSYTFFQHRYAVMGGYGGYEVVAYRIYPTVARRGGEERPNPNYDPNVEREFHGKLYSIAYRVGSEVLDLPDSTDVTRATTLGKEGRRVYDDLDADLFAEFADDEEEISTANALVRLLRLQQITGGAVTTDSGEEREVDRAKRNLLAEVLQDLPQNEPVVVFCRFVHDLAKVREVADEQERKYGEISGRRSDLASDATFPTDVDVMGVQIQSGGVGIDLSRAAYGIYYSLGFSLGDYQQSRARLVRPGQERSVLFIHLVCASTVDETVYDALEQRAEVVDHVMSKRTEGVEVKG